MATEPRPWVEPLARLEALTQQCVHCGLCLPTCPTYALLGTEMDSPRGRIYLIRALREGRIDPTEVTLNHLDRCLDCRACESACPSGVRYGAILEGARAALEPTRSRPAVTRALRHFAFRNLLSERRWLRAAGALLRLGHAFGIRRLAAFLPAALRRAALVAPIPRGDAFLDQAPALFPAVGAVRGRVGLFVGCAMDQVHGDVHRATVSLLTRAGFEVAVPRDQTCCGALQAHNGERGAARDLVARNLASFEGLEAVVVNSAGCGAQLAELESLFPAHHGSGREIARAHAFSARCLDLSTFLHHRVKFALSPGVPAASGAPGLISAVYDAPCHLLHAQKEANAPLALLRRVPGIELRPLTESDWCCGAAGIYNLTQPILADRLLDRKLDHIEASGAHLVITANPGCMIQLEAGLASRGATVEVLHLAELLDRFGLSAEPGSQR
ncbi:MAG: 4Fe-4S dicluster domain-containing protein [Candidatus Eisenbacteria bacterium]|nr:4Fe-4S dicluster domain-containing protein [Candidatus Eisenbacteria bacterium]